MFIQFQTHPDSYHHWRLSVKNQIARLVLDVKEDKGLFSDYKLKLNSYDLSVDIELADAVFRIRFEHPEVKVVVISSGNERAFSAGANIFMLGQSSHEFKVNFCKFTNETRLYMEDASLNSDIHFLCAASGTTAGGGYELALACDEIILVDDGNSAVSLPEVPLLGVLPGTGGLTRLVDKRKVRKDLADVFCTLSEGIKGDRAVSWNLVDAVVSKSNFQETVEKRVQTIARQAEKSSHQGIKLAPITCHSKYNIFKYDYVHLEIDAVKRLAQITIEAPRAPEPESVDAILEMGSELWALKAFRELDEAILKLRFNFPEIGLIVFKSKGNPTYIMESEKSLLQLSKTQKPFWFAKEVLLHMKRVLKRIDVTSRSIVALVEPKSAFAGSLAELVFAADRSYMLSSDESFIYLSNINHETLPMGNGLSRLEARYYGAPAVLEKVQQRFSEGPIDAKTCQTLGLVTYVLDEIDYEDEVRLFLEERTCLSPDALTGMEANLRFIGPETLETKIFSRLSAWQNWIFIRDNATGPTGALSNYGKPTRPQFDFTRC